MNKAIEYKFYLEQNGGKIYAELEAEKGGDFQSLPKVTTETTKQVAEKSLTGVTTFRPNRQPKSRRGS